MFIYTIKTSRTVTQKKNKTIIYHKYFYTDSNVTGNLNLIHSISCDCQRHHSFTVFIVASIPVTTRADGCCTISCNNSPTASDVEAVDVDLKPTSTTSPLHSHTAFSSILVVGDKKQSIRSHAVHNHPVRFEGIVAGCNHPQNVIMG